ncbi:MAG: T9SS type A sorting domain-containing protein [Calditrichaceae bacterium]|nr:T9SS type A sorting domain-containing protein [Calditrichaceae bacterium]
MRIIKILIIPSVFFFVTILSAQTTKLFWADQTYGKIQSAKLDGTEKSDLITELNQPIGLAIDTESSPNKLYFCERGDSKIYRANLDGSDTVAVITGITGIYDIELDLVNRKIYWVRDTYADDAVQRADMDGLNSNIEDMYTSTSTSYDFLGVGLDVTNSKVYWVQRNNGCSDKISSMNFDKTGHTYVITHPANSLLGPWDIDIVGNKIYWSDCGLSEDIIYKANLDGSNIDTVLKDVDCQYFVIDPATDKIYFADNSLIQCANLDGTGRDTVVTGVGGFVMGIGISHNAPTDITENKVPLESFHLYQNYPNPFNPSTTIRYSVGAQNSVETQNFASQQVELSIYNLLGQKVATLVNTKQPAGDYKVEWDASNIPSGVYFYKLETDNGFSQTKKLMLIK